MEKTIIIIVVIVIIIAIIIFRVRINRRSIREVDGVTRKLRESNEKRQINDTGIRKEVDNLRTNNDTRSDIDNETRKILEGAKHR